MIKIALLLGMMLASVASCFAQECIVPVKNPFVYETGKLSVGIVAGDTLALYDIFKRAGSISARVGGSVTLAKYERFGAFMGAAAPTSDPSAVALVAGPSFEMDDVARAMISSMLNILPFKIEATTEQYLNDAVRLKIYGGYDFRYQSVIAGAGFGVGLF